MVENSREGTPTWTQYMGWPYPLAGARGYYYTTTTISTACPPGWSVPHSTELMSMLSRSFELPAERINERRFWEEAPYGLAGKIEDGGWHTAWDMRSAWAVRINAHYTYAFFRHWPWANAFHVIQLSPFQSVGVSVRCIRDK